jgi:hypothetical protein
MGYTSESNIIVELKKNIRRPLIHLDFHITPQRVPKNDTLCVSNSSVGMAELS